MQDEQAALVQEQRHDRAEQRKRQQRIVDIRRRLDLDAAGIGDQEGADGLPCQILLPRLEAESSSGLGRRVWQVDWADRDQDVGRSWCARLQLGQLDLRSDRQAIGLVEALYAGSTWVPVIGGDASP